MLHSCHDTGEINKMSDDKCSLIRQEAGYMLFIILYPFHRGLLAIWEGSHHVIGYLAEAGTIL